MSLREITLTCFLVYVNREVSHSLLLLPKHPEGTTHLELIYFNSHSSEYSLKAQGTEICKFSLGKCLFNSSTNFLISLFDTEFYNFLCTLSINPSLEIGFAIYFLPFSRLPFYFVDCFFCSAEHLLYAQMLIVASVACAFSVISKNIIAKTNVKDTYLNIIKNV